MFGKVFVVFQELFVVFADMDHRIKQLEPLIKTCADRFPEVIMAQQGLV